jgi:hypothetical protein
MTEQEKRAKEKEGILAILNLNPQIFQTGIGVEAFVEDLIKTSDKYSSIEFSAMMELSKIISNFPQIVRPEGAEAFIENLHKAAIKFDECFGRK